jgi:hypothetical protein
MLNLLGAWADARLRAGCERVARLLNGRLLRYLDLDGEAGDVPRWARATSSIRVV